MAETFRPFERLRRRAEFQKVFESGTKLHGRLMTVFFLPNSLTVGRLGTVATRKLGGAVQRNRAKRLLREVFRQNKLPGFDIVILARRELVEAPFASIEADYRGIVRRHLSYLNPRGRSPGSQPGAQNPRTGSPGSHTARTSRGRGPGSPRRTA
jgi:ribonuclease P protein component